VLKFKNKFGSLRVNEEESETRGKEDLEKAGKKVKVEIIDLNKFRKKWFAHMKGGGEPPAFRPESTKCIEVQGKSPCGWQTHRKPLTPQNVCCASCRRLHCTLADWKRAAFFFCQYETGSVCREIYVLGTSSGRPRGEMNSQMRIIH
jgi:hypothetical protein